MSVSPKSTNFTKHDKTKNEIFKTCSKFTKKLILLLLINNHLGIGLDILRYMMLVCWEC